MVVRYVSFAVVSDMDEAESGLQLVRDKHIDPFEMDKRSKFFWINEWVGIYRETVAYAQSFEEFNGKGNLFKHHIAENFTDKHFFASIFLFPPKSNFTPPQRVAVAMLLLCGIIFANAFFYKGDQQLSFASAMYIGFISSLIVTPPTGAVIGAFRWAGRGGNRYSRKWFVRCGAWFVAVVSSAWCCYYVLLLSFAWGQDKSWQWLSSCGTSFAISTLVTDIIYITTAAAIAAYLHQIDDLATVKELAQQRMATKLAVIQQAEALTAGGLHLADVFDDDASEEQSVDGRWSQAAGVGQSSPAKARRSVRVKQIVADAMNATMALNALAIGEKPPDHVGWSQLQEGALQQKDELPPDTATVALWGHVRSSVRKKNTIAGLVEGIVAKKSSRSAKKAGIPSSHLGAVVDKIRKESLTGMLSSAEVCNLRDRVLFYRLPQRFFSQRVDPFAGFLVTETTQTLQA